MNLGELFATVDIITAPFDRKYTAIVGRLRSLGAEGERAASGVRTLDRQFLAAAGSADKATASTNRTAAATQKAAAAQEKAAAASRLRSDAETRLGAVLGRVAGSSAKVQEATLRQAAAQERSLVATGAGNREFARMASAQASVISSTRALAREQEAAAASSGKFVTGLKSGVKMAGELGLLFGAIEVGKKALDITKEARDFQRDMLLIHTQAGASMGEVNALSGSVLKLAGPVATAPEKLATSLYHIESVGLRGARAMMALKIAAEGAKVGNADLEQTTNALTATVASNIKGVANMSQAMGALNAIVGAGDMKLSDLNAALGTGVLTVARTFNVSLTQAGAALATFGDNNIRGADAATALRMSIQDLAKPAAHADDVLSQIGLTSAKLKADLARGGLTTALQDLRDHMDAAGITAGKVGPFIVDAFTKRAGTGLAILLEQMARYDSKLAEVGAGAHNFGEEWKRTTQTASFALASLWTRVEAGGITIARNLNPAVATAANWLGKSLPHALSVLGGALGPTIHMAGGLLAGAWRTVTAVLRPAAAMLGAVGHLAAQNGGVVRDLATATLALWVAMKGYQLGVIAFEKLSTAITLTRVRLLELKESGALGAGVLGLITLGAYSAGKALSNTIEKGNSFVGTMNNLGHQADDWKQSIIAANGALTQSTRLQVAEALQANGLADKAAKAGISLTQMTDAVIGGHDATQALIDTWRKSGKPSDDTIAALALMSVNYTKTQSAAIAANSAMKDTGKATHGVAGPSRQMGNNLAAITQGYAHAAAAAQYHAAATQKDATVLQYNIDAQGNLVRVAVKAGSAIDNTSSAMQRQTIASSILKNSLDYLNGVQETVETTEDSLRQGLGGLADKSALATSKNGDLIRSLRQSSAAGAQNRQTIVSLIDAAKAHAAAVADQARKNGETLPNALRAGNAALKADEGQILAAARAAGLNTTQVRNLISRMGQLARLNVTPKINAPNTAPVMRAIQRIRDAMGNLQGTVYLTPSGNLAGSGLGARGATMQAAGTQAAFGRSTIPPNTRFTVGERGWEGGVTDAQGRATIFSNAQSKAMGFRAPVAYASGTVGSIEALLHSLGVNRAGIAGFLGNMKVESSFSTSAYNAREGAMGLVQWEGGRGNALKSIAARLGVGWSSLKAQLALMKRELTGPYAGVLSMLRGVTNPATAAAIIDRSYEGSSGSTRGTRMSDATAIYRALGSTGGAGITAGGISSDIKATAKAAAAAAHAAAVAAHASVGAAAALTGSIHTRYTADAAGNLHGSIAPAATIRQNLYNLEGDLHKAGVPANLIQRMQFMNAGIILSAQRRNAFGNQAAAANARRVAALGVERSDTTAFHDAAIAGFSTPTADAVTGRVTAGSILAGRAQEINRMKLFLNGLHRLAGKIPPGTLRRLYNAGPDNGGLEEVQAYVSMSASQLKLLNTQQAQLGAIANAGAAFGAKTLDQHAVDVAARQEKLALAREKRQQKALDERLTRLENVVRNVRVAGDATIKWPKGQLEFVLAAEQKHNKKATRGH